jgi:hypothetical protein
MRTLVDELIVLGVVPILSTIPDPQWDSWYYEKAFEYNKAILDIANEKRVALINFWLALQPLPGLGVSADTVHPSVAPTGAADFTDEGLQYGYNVRNKITLEALGALHEATSPQ